MRCVDFEYAAGAHSHQDAPEAPGPCQTTFILRGLSVYGMWSDICRHADEAIIRQEEKGYRQSFPPSDPGGWKAFQVVRQRVYEEVLPCINEEDAEEELPALPVEAEAPGPCQTDRIVRGRHVPGGWAEEVLPCINEEDA